jgi:hypothetical protein
MKKLTLIPILFACLFLPTNLEASSSGLVVNEFRTRGTSSYDEYIVLANYGFASVSLQNFSLYKKTSSGANYSLFKFSAYTLNPQQKVIIAGKDFDGEKDFLYSSGNTLADTNNAIIIEDSFKNIIDSVTYGSVNFPLKEGTALANPESGIAYKRKNGQDTDNNSADFEAVKNVPSFDQNADRVILTEMVPDPKSGEEWIEIYNPLNVAVSLSGLSLCDRMGATHCYGLKETIPPFGYISYDASKTKITLNNDGDIVELKNSSGKVISTSQSSFGKSTENCSYGLFGSSWKWTKVPTKGAPNVLSILTNPGTTAKAIKNKSTGISQKVPAYTSLKEGEKQTTEADTEEVKGTETESKVGKREVGIALIVLAIIGLIGYTIYENRERINDFYHQKFRRNN